MVLLILASLLLIGAIWFLRKANRTKRSLFRYIGLSGILLCVLLLIVWGSEYLHCFESFLRKLLLEKLIPNAANNQEYYHQLAANFNITSYVTTFFAMGTACLALAGNRRGNGKNPYKLFEYFSVRIFLIALATSLELEISFLILRLTVLQCIIFCFLAFLCFGFSVYYYLYHDDEHTRRIMIQQLKRKAPENPDNLLRIITKPKDIKWDWKNDQGVEGFKETIREVERWGILLYNRQKPEQTDPEELADHLVKTISCSFGKKSNWEARIKFGSYMLPFCWAYAIISPKQEADEDVYRRRFCSLLYAVSRAEIEDELRFAMIEGFILARIKLISDKLYSIKKHKSEPFDQADEIGKKLRELYLDCEDYLGIRKGDDSESLARSVFEVSTRIWVGISCCFGTWADASAVSSAKRSLNISRRSPKPKDISENQLYHQTYTLIYMLSKEILLERWKKNIIDSYTGRANESNKNNSRRKSEKNKYAVAMQRRRKNS